jgi:hypothetical protein
MLNHLISEEEVAELLMLKQGTGSKYGNYCNQNLIQNYCASSLYDELNSALYNSKETLDVYYSRVESLLNRSLDKCPSYNSKRVYRGSACFIEHIKWFKINVGSTFCVPAFMSTFREEIYPHNVIIKTCENSNARDINEYLENAIPNYEKEILFKSKTCFKILDVDLNNEKVCLQEISNYTSIDFPHFCNETVLNDSKYKQYITDDDLPESLSDQRLI